MKVIKRNGTEEEFSEDKIRNVFSRVFKENKCNKFECTDPAIESLISELYNQEHVKVETIQGKIETLLYKFSPQLAKAFIIYRYEHKQAALLKDRLDYISSYTDTSTNAASASETDANSNVSCKNISNLEGEVYKTTNRLIQRKRMKGKLYELYPKEDLGKQYVDDLENHIIYTHDEASSPVLKPYCAAISLYPLMMEGVGNIDNITPSAPNDLRSFTGQLDNLIFLVSSQIKGAVAIGDYFITLNYYVIKDFGEKWYDRLKEEFDKNHNNIEHYIRKSMKELIYKVNQPAGNRSYNSPFTNVSYYDSVYFKALFEDYCYPDGTKPEWHAIDILQRMFMQLHRELRLIKPLTFPVSTMAMVHDNKEFLDPEYKELCAEEWAKGGSFFCYNNDNPNSLSSCCFSADTKFLWKSSSAGVSINSFEDFYNAKYVNVKENYKIFHNGSWIYGKVVRYSKRKMYKITTQNNKEYLMTDNHINVTYDTEKETSQLTTNDYLMFNTKGIEPIKENDEHLTYNQGLLVGLFIGDGTFGNYVCLDNSVHSFMLSLNENKYNKVKEILDSLGDFKLTNIHNNVYPVRCYDKELTTFIAKWTGNEPNKTHAENKSLNLNCLTQSKEFRQGILDGWYITDGGNSNRCYTVSKELVERMETLCTSLGKQTVINISDRTDEACIIRGIAYNRNFPLYCLRWFSDANSRVRPESGFKWKNNSIYWKIKSIEEVEYDKDYVYCVECKNQDEPYFTLPSGLITHNCRVCNEINDNTFSSTTGMTGVMTGSCNVITLNLNRITQDWYRYNGMKPNEDKILLTEYLTRILDRVYKYQIAYKTMLYDMEDKHLFSPSNGGYIYISKLYSTIGVLGYYEAAKFLGYKTNNNKPYKTFLAEIFSCIKDGNKKHSVHNSKRPIIFNTEAVPGENLAVKLYKADKKDGYMVPENQNLYNCYFYNPWNETSVLDKIKLHGSDVCKYLGGGQACHINLDSHLTKEQYLKLLDIAMENGTNYFTFNIPMSECADCGHVVNAPIEECPICHSKHIKTWTRIIGYLTCVDNWSKDRQIEQKQRVYLNE